MDMLEHALDSSQDRDGDSNDTKELLSAQALTIVEDDGSLGSGGEDQGGVVDLEPQGLLEADDDLQYQFRSSEGGTVTYRVVVPSANGDSMEQMPQIVSSSGSFHGSSNVQSGVHTVALSSSLNGQFYVIGSTNEVFGGQGSRSFAPRSSVQLESSRTSGSRDDRRRATHNEVERRRRDKINNWIGKLSKIIPDCNSENAKTVQSKGGILAKACEYIVELRSTNQKLGECIKEQETLAMDMDRLRRQNEELKRANAILRAQLAQNGIVPKDEPLS